jgi:glutathione S-transferase
MKLYNNNIANVWTSAVTIVADLAHVKLEETVVNQEEIQSKEFKAKTPSGKFPFIEAEEGTLFESAAIARYV